jgi:hypothetical protein
MMSDTYIAAMGTYRLKIRRFVSLVGNVHAVVVICACTLRNYFRNSCMSVTPGGTVQFGRVDTYSSFLKKRVKQFKYGKTLQPAVQLHKGINSFDPIALQGLI